MLNYCNMLKLTLLDPGQEEKALEDAKRKKAKEAEVAEKQQKRRKNGNGSQEEDGSDGECGNEVQQKAQSQVPSEVNGALTHSTVAIFQALETCDGDYLNNMNGSGFTAWYRSMLPVASPSNLDDVLANGPLAILHVDDTIANDQEQRTWHPPTWWDECSQKLERTCVANIPEDTSPSFFVGP